MYCLNFYKNTLLKKVYTRVKWVMKIIQFVICRPSEGRSAGRFTKKWPLSRLCLMCIQVDGSFFPSIVRVRLSVRQLKQYRMGKWVLVDESSFWKVCTMVVAGLMLNLVAAYKTLLGEDVLCCNNLIMSNGYRTWIVRCCTNFTTTCTKAKRLFFRIYLILNIFKTDVIKFKLRTIPPCLWFGCTPPMTKMFCPDFVLINRKTTVRRQSFWKGIFLTFGRDGQLGLIHNNLNQGGKRTTCHCKITIVKQA